MCVYHMFVQRAFHLQHRCEMGQKILILVCLCVWLHILYQFCGLLKRFFPTLCNGSFQWCHFLLFLILIFLFTEIVRLVDLVLMQIFLLVFEHVYLWFQNLDTISVFWKLGWKKRPNLWMSWSGWSVDNMLNNVAIRCHYVVIKS